MKIQQIERMNYYLQLHINFKLKHILYLYNQNIRQPCIKMSLYYVLIVLLARVLKGLCKNLTFSAIEQGRGQTYNTFSFNCLSWPYLKYWKFVTASHPHGGKIILMVNIYLENYMTVGIMSVHNILYILYTGSANILGLPVI